LRHASNGVQVAPKTSKKDTIKPMKIRAQRVYYFFTGTVFTCAFLVLAAIASGQNLFVVDFGSTNIYEFSPGGAQSARVSGVKNPFRLAFDSAGNLYVSEFEASDILKFTPGGVKSVYASGINEPAALAFDQAGNLFVAQGNGTITEIKTNGTPSTIDSDLQGAYGLAFDKAGNLFAADTLGGAIYKYAPGGARTTFASGLGDPGPTAIAFDTASNLYVAIATSNTIIEFPAGGTQKNFASLYNPWGLAFDNAGDLFVTEGNGGSITKINVHGGQSTFASGFTNLIGLAFNPAPQLAGASGNGAFQLTVSTPSPSPYGQTIVQASTDLINWSNVYTNVSPFVFTDSFEAGTRYRFYRTVMWP
jgi:hypothetical protein